MKKNIEPNKEERMGNEKRKRSIVDMQFSTFEIPPAGEVLIVAKRSPIGPEAAKRMLDSVAPDQFELIQPDDDLIDGILVKKYLFLRADKKALIDMLLEEAKPIMSPQCMMTIKCDVTVIVSRGI